MADKANITVYNDKEVSVLFKPATSYAAPAGAVMEEWAEYDTTLAQNLRGRITLSSTMAKSGVERRMIKVSMPSAREIPSAATNIQGYTPDSAVAFHNRAYIVVEVDPRATDTDIANVVAMLSHVLSGLETTEASNTWASKTNPAAEFAIHGLMPD